MTLKLSRCPGDTRLGQAGLVRHGRSEDAEAKPEGESGSREEVGDSEA